MVLTDWNHQNWIMTLVGPPMVFVWRVQITWNHLKQTWVDMFVCFSAADLSPDRKGQFLNTTDHRLFDAFFFFLRIRKVNLQQLLYTYWRKVRTKQEEKQQAVQDAAELIKNSSVRGEHPIRMQLCSLLTWTSKIQTFFWGKHHEDFGNQFHVAPPMRRVSTMLSMLEEKP